MKKYLKNIPIALLILIAVSCNKTPESFSFVQICDPQLGMGGYDHDTATLEQAVRQINEMDIDFAIFCGDLVNHDIGMVPNDTTLAFYRSTMGEDYYTLPQTADTVTQVLN
jgi:hypothetical protein